MAPPDFKPASSSGDRPLSNLSRLTIKELQDFLDADYINFEANSSKPKLQALFALSHLGFLNAGDTLKRDFLAALTLFCQISVSGQIRILKEKGLDTSGLKGDHIEVWIRAKLDNGESAFENLHLGNSDDDATLVVTDDTAEDDTLAPAVLNLLLTSIYLEIAQSGNLKLLPGCPAKTAGAARQHLDAFTKFKTTNDVTAVLKGASSPAKALVSWICSTLGQDLVRATGDLEISGFPDSVHQFIVVKPVPALQGPFDAHMKTDSPRSIVLFHGTPLANLRSILSTGFRGARGLWMAAEPAISYGYAAKACYGIPNSSIIEWTGGPYPNSQVGALLGCEVSGKGRPLGHGIHVILNLKSIMVRYIFLLPFGDGRECVDYSKAPARAVVEPAIRAAFTKIRSNESKTPSSAESKEDMTVSDPSTAADSTRRKVAAKKTAK